MAKYWREEQEVSIFEGNSEFSNLRENLNRVVQDLGVDLAKCLIELMDNGIQFRPGDWGVCPMGYLAYAKRKGECDVESVKALDRETKVHFLMAEEIALPERPETDYWLPEGKDAWAAYHKALGQQSTMRDEPRLEFARLLGTTPAVVSAFAGAWDGIVGLIEEELRDVLKEIYPEPRYPDDAYNAAVYASWEKDMEQWRSKTAVPDAAVYRIAHRLLRAACNNVVWNVPNEIALDDADN